MKLQFHDETKQGCTVTVDGCLLGHIKQNTNGMFGIYFNPNNPHFLLEDELKQIAEKISNS